MNHGCPLLFVKPSTQIFEKQKFLLESKQDSMEILEFKFTNIGITLHQAPSAGKTQFNRHQRTNICNPEQCKHTLNILKISKSSMSLDNAHHLDT